MSKHTVQWQAVPERHDYAAAADYLSLLASTVSAKIIAADLERLADRATYDGQQLPTRKAKDILRASELPLLDVDNAHVAKDLGKIRDGDLLSPILLVRGDATRSIPLTIADGYHRVCASYWTDENTDIPFVITDW